MNCYGTNPQYTQNTQQTNSLTRTNTNPYNTTTSGEWSEPIPTNPNMPTSPASVMPAPVMPAELPTTLTESIYTPGYLRQHIGDLMRVEFLIGNGTTDRVGRLRQVGASFIVLAALDGGSEILCDIYSIKFVTIIQSLSGQQLYTAFPG